MGRTSDLRILAMGDLKVGLNQIMKMKKRLVALVTGWLCTCLFVGSIPSAAAIASPQLTSLTRADVTDIPSFSAVETFLYSMPNDYYTVKQIGRLKTIINTQNAMLIDVRENSEFRAGHIESAINIPLRSLTDNLNKIPKERPVILYCSSGYRTGMGVMSLKMLGYGNVQGFPPSIQGWKAAGEHLVSSDVQTMSFGTKKTTNK